MSLVAASNLAQAPSGASPTNQPPAPELSRDQGTDDTHSGGVPADLNGGHDNNGTHCHLAPVDIAETT